MAQNYANPKEERTLVLVKPDGVKRGLVGEILTRFEKRGLKIIALKMIQPTKEHISGHYQGEDEWLETIGEKTKSAFEKQGLDLMGKMGTNESKEIGRKVKGWLEDFMTSGPVVAMVIQGMHAISTVRKIVGHTYPIESAPGTIRGDLSVDTPTAANVEGRAVRNLVHASGDEKEAAHEILHWFAPEEIHGYKRADEDVMF
ncbi:MAG: nucleoside-diphosphate kinase [Candidatus Niyogibacteria bacterium]|nr:MAG: nucleoside-diphosphate kinase [Candidatus Niyogibacteria bacterium]